MGTPIEVVRLGGGHDGGGRSIIVAVLRIADARVAPPSQRRRDDAPETGREIADVVVVEADQRNSTDRCVISRYSGCASFVAPTIATLRLGPRLAVMARLSSPSLRWDRRTEGSFDPVTAERR
jgi:hypothetical protein